ncbi:hypothetical protein CDD80_530 [Ophiocordyceps camponoti-rufipedis]|uniref:RxLR effector protein n=1 Tax=Ophiocordyceps camponoti-rufipedis TaxID=2004952 RepID=A0A2C5YHG2_9HYPO|nr:hypothetical protein CDD80_530 [Ophiocordyceps camponoti-rufipedis]
MKFITNVLLFGAFATSVLSTAIPEMGEAVEEGVSTVADAPGAVFAEAKRMAAIHLMNDTTWGSRSSSSRRASSDIDLDAEMYRREYVRQVLREQDRETARRLSEYFGADIRALSRDEIVTPPRAVHR